MVAASVSELVSALALASVSELVSVSELELELVSASALVLVLASVLMSELELESGLEASFHGNVTKQLPPPNGAAKYVT